MPTSFSRILNEEDLAEVRNQYLQALEALEEEEADAEEEDDDSPRSGAESPEPEQKQQP
ncbi:hypothetical protein [Streptomyces genisteinicus]|uniref:Uncharacterized protein n=1 Tax=Streptomyces genisteinicus TaxID=2768068 RepID=A0A7H0I1F8_9ACTN|nr:hypothetical protein [Streptomyces genisteinicus]QNP66624.1 hypothetical protein IAG43_29360 [Streptomyces genisteinicus]